MSRITGPFERPETATERITSWWAWLVEPWSRDRDEFEIRLLSRINLLEARMTTAEDAQYARAREIVGLIRAEFASLQVQLAAAIADKDAAVAAGVESALGADAEADASRLSGLVDELASALPGAVPDVPVPGPGEPAELPAEEPAPAPEPEAPAEPVADGEQPA